MKKWFVLLLMALVLLMAAGCAPEEPATQSPSAAPGGSAETEGETSAQVEAVYVGSVWPTTGANAELGISSENAVQLAAEDINEAGGIEALGGAKIVVISGDAQSDPSVTVSEVERIASAGNISAFVGCQASSLTLSATEVTERLKIPMITYSVSNDLCGRGFRYTFQAVPYGSEYGAAPVKYAQAMMDKYGTPENKVACIYEETSYGVDTSAGILAAIEDCGQNLVLDYAYEQNMADASSLVLKIKNSGANIVYCCSTLNDAVLIQRTLKANNVAVIVIGCGVGHSHASFASTLGEDANYVAVSESASALMSMEGLAEMVAEYEQKYGKGTFNNNAFGSYRIMWILKAAIEACGSADPEAITDALYEVVLTEGVPAWCFGMGCDFDETGHNTLAAMGALQWQDGTLVPVWPEGATDYEAVWPTPPWSER